MEIFIIYILHKITFLLGLVGILIILLGTIDGLFIYLKDRRNFQKIRYVIGKHILLGLDFLVVKDIIETVFLKGTDIHVMDIILLITIVGIRILLTNHTMKGITEMRTEMEKSKIHTKAIDQELEDIENEEKILERKIKDLENSDKISEEKRKELEDKIKKLSKLLAQNKKKKSR